VPTSVRTGKRAVHGTSFGVEASCSPSTVGPPMVNASRDL